MYIYGDVYVHPNIYIHNMDIYIYNTMLLLLKMVTKWCWINCVHGIFLCFYFIIFPMDQPFTSYLNCPEVAPWPLNLYLPFPKINTSLPWPFLSSFEMNGRDAKFSFCKPKHFGRWAERRYWVSYFTQLVMCCLGRAHWENTSRHCRLCTPPTQCPSFPLHREPGFLCTVHSSSSLLHFYLATYFWPHFYACRCGFLPSGELAGTLWSESSCPWTLDTLLPMKSQQRNDVDRQP